MNSRALLLDESLSPKLAKALEREFPGMVHVRQFNMLGMPDIELWRFAAEHKYCIVSPDSDFNELAYVNGPPPQVVWLRMGNATTSDIGAKLLARKNVIEDFISRNTEAVLEIA